MKQFSSLSSEVRSVIDKFDKLAPRSFLSFVDCLVLSLYIQRPDADNKVIEVLVAKHNIVNLSDYLEQSEIELLHKNYREIVLDRFPRNSSFHIGFVEAGRNILPEEVVDLCLYVTDIKEKARLYIPYVGDFRILDLADDSIECVGFESNPMKWAMMRIYLEARGIPADIQLGETYTEKGRYDNIFTYPPVVGKESEITDYLYNLATNHLAQDGRLVCLVPISICDDDVWKRFRKLIASSSKNFSIDIISLPTGLHYPAPGELCLITILNNGEGRVTLVDASSFVFCDMDEFHISFTLNTEGIKGALKHEPKDLVWRGNFEDLYSDVSLLPSHYLSIVKLISRASSREYVLRVDHLIESVKSEAIEAPQAVLMPLVGVRQLKDSYMACDLDAEVIPVQEVNGKRLVAEDCFLFSFYNGVMRIARLHGVSKDKPVAIENYVYPFRIREVIEDQHHCDKKLKISDFITIDYLLRSLYDENTRKLASIWSRGANLSYPGLPDDLSEWLPEASFKKLCIVVPRDISEQERLCKADLVKAMGDNALRILEQSDAFRKDMHMKKHALGQTLFNLNNWWEVLQSARSKGNGVVCDTTVISSVRQVTVADVYESLEKVMAKLNKQLSRFDTGYGMSQETFNLVEAVVEYATDNPSPLFVFDGVEELLSLKNIRVTFSHEALKMVLNNIISNAVSHGFSEDKRDENKIRIGLEARGSDYVLTVANNGAPLKITEEDVFIYGQTSGETEEHFGIGGYEIKKLMNEFDGDAELISSPDEEFTVTYRLVFHNTGL